MKFLISSFFLLLVGVATYAQAPAIRVERQGSGKPILFLPGFITPGRVWNETIRHLEGQHQTHVVTYAGFDGLAPIDTPWYPRLRTALIAYIRKENLSGLTVIGHSMGGTLAVDLAAELPDRIDRLILVDALPAMRDLMMPGVTADQVQYNAPYNKQVLQMNEEAFGKMATMMAGGMTSVREKADTIKSWILNADRRTYVYGYTDLMKLDLREALTRVKAKTLILGATFPTADVARGTLEKQYANLNGKRIEMAPGSRHFIMFDQPGWFYQQVNDFLR